MLNYLHLEKQIFGFYESCNLTILNFRIRGLKEIRIMNYKQGYDGKYLMDIKERDKLSNIGDKFDKKQNPSDKDKQEYYDAFIKYLDYVEKYCDKEFRGKIFTYDHIIPQVFVTEMKSENAYK